MKLTINDAFISVEGDKISIGKNDYSRVEMSHTDFALFTKFVNDFATKPSERMMYLDAATLSQMHLEEGSSDPFEYHKAVAEDETLTNDVTETDDIPF